MNKFKLGDRVEVVSDRFKDDHRNQKGIIGVVSAVYCQDKKDDLDTLSYQIEEENSKIDYANSYHYTDLKFRPFTKLEKALK